MKILILNGNSEPENQLFEEYLVRLTSGLRKESCEVETLVLRDIDLHRCTGCFTCWLKTPGICCYPDNHELLVRAYVRAEIVVFASPLLMGFTSSLLKLATEKLLPVVLPYINIATGESRHSLRYPVAPGYVVLVQDEPDTTPVDHELVTEIYSRFARNAQTTLVGYNTTSTAAEDVSHAIAHAQWFTTPQPLQHRNPAAALQ